MVPRPYRQAPAVHRLIRWLAATRTGALLLAGVLPRADMAWLRVTRGRGTLTGAVSGLPVVALRTVGARSGLDRTTPVLGIPVGPDMAVAAGNFGRSRTPGWCVNLRANPHARVLVHGAARQVIARNGRRRT